MKHKPLCLMSLIALMSCVAAEPLTPKQQAVTDAAYLKVTVEQCAVVVGFEGLMRIQDHAKKLEATARAAGATDADFQRAETNMRTGFALSSGMKGTPMTCGDFMTGSSQIIAKSV